MSHFLSTAAISLLLFSISKLIILPAFLSLFSLKNTQCRLHLRIQHGMDSPGTPHGARITLYPLGPSNACINRPSKGLDELSVASLDGLRQVYLNGFGKDPWYMDVLTKYGMPNMVSMVQHKPHADRKRTMSLVYSEPFLYRSLDFQISSSVLLYERLLLVLASAAYGTKPLEVYSLSMACGTDFIRNTATRDKYFGLCHTKLYQRPSHEKATRKLETMTLARCLDAERFSHGLPGTTGPSPNTVKPEARETDLVGYCILSSELTEICVGSDGATAQKKISSIVSELCDQVSASRQDISITPTYIP